MKNSSSVQILIRISSKGYKSDSQGSGYGSQGRFCFCISTISDTFLGIAPVFWVYDFNAFWFSGFPDNLKIRLPERAEINIGFSSDRTPSGDQVYLYKSLLGPIMGPSVAKKCAKAVEDRIVPCISLEKVIEEWLGGHAVAWSFNQYSLVRCKGSPMKWHLGRVQGCAGDSLTWK